MKPVIFFILFFLLFPSALFADSLVALREAELSMLSRCPGGQSVAIVGDVPAAMIVTDVSNGSAVTVVERARLSEVMGEICADFVDPSSQVAAGNLIFATHLFEVTGNIVPDGGTYTIRGIRTDTGAEVYQQSFNVSSPEELNTHVEAGVNAVRNSALSNPVECKDKFDFVVEEDVSLKCAGSMGFMPMNYNVQADMKLQFILKDIKNEVRGAQQTINGSVRVLPSKVTTILNSTLSGGGDCPEVLQTTRTISIPLKDRSRKARIGLTISQNGRDPWKLSALVTDPQPLFEAAATMDSTHIGSDCDTPATPEHQHNLPFKFLEMNLFRFAQQEFSPLCSQPSSSELVFATSPKFGVTPLPSPGLTCQKNLGTFSTKWRRQF